MKAKECMSTNPEYLPPTASLQEAAEFMKKNDCGFAPIGENDRLIGAITDRDITVRAVAEGLSPSTKIKDVHSSKIQYCFEEDEIEDVAKKMQSLQIRRLVVLNDKKRMTGILALGDIATKGKNVKVTGELTASVSK